MKEAILKLRTEGLSYKDIKQQLGCSLGTISFHCGNGQKEKTNTRNRKRLKTIKGNIDRRVRKFIGEKLRDYRRAGGISDTISVKEVIEKIKANPICYLTGRKIDLLDFKSYEFDHIIPKSRGGANTIDNLGLSCRIANRSKTEMTVEEYLKLCEEVLVNYGVACTKAGDVALQAT